jgi:phosphomannomutase
MDRIEAALPEAFPGGSVETEYGVRVELPDGDWTLVRPSGTEPYVRIYAESDDVDALVDEVVRVVSQAVESVS